MNQARAEAVKLRLKGHSYNEINKKLGIPKSTLANWLRNIVLSDSARQRLAKRLKIGSLVLIKRNKMQTHEARQRAHLIRTFAQQRIGTFTNQELLLAGALLYWAEGYKRPLVRWGREITSHPISFVNADEDMVRLFIKFLRDILNIVSGDIVLSMRLYDHINEQEALRYWMKVTNLTKENFRTTTRLVSLASQRKRPFNRLPYGMLQVGVYDTPKFHEIMGLIEGVRSQCRYDIVHKLPR